MQAPTTTLSYIGFYIFVCFLVRASEFAVIHIFCFHVELTLHVNTYSRVASTTQYIRESSAPLFVVVVCTVHFLTSLDFSFGLGVLKLHVLLYVWLVNTDVTRHFIIY